MPHLRHLSLRTLLSAGYLLLNVVLLIGSPRVLQAAPMVPIRTAQTGWDGQLQLTLVCTTPPTDTVIQLPDGRLITPEQLIPLIEDPTDPAAAAWDVRFRLPPQTFLVSVIGCDQPNGTQLIIAQPPLNGLWPVIGVGTLLLLSQVAFYAYRRAAQPTVPHTSAALQPWTLAVWDGRQEWFVPLRTTSVTVGHHADCDVPLIGPAVAARHIRLLIEPDALRVVDLGANGGTFVGPVRRRLRAGETVMVQSDEEIVLGTSVRLRLTPTADRNVEQRRSEIALIKH